jgi:hypothetical protein
VQQARLAQLPAEMADLHAVTEELAAGPVGSPQEHARTGDELAEREVPHR